MAKPRLTASDLAGSAAAARLASGEPNGANASAAAEAPVWYPSIAATSWAHISS
ncbi:Uncharacterised protein [Mycobacterium tuberculosis]|nr:Uncharacterised protein [Mycobacterium tuberculosis]CKU21153.1 Uncharacterised protein [Mycobacterium tuberculosis]SGO77887.1 Uncharacterised protein [Mycobacterium tuberculosis]